MKLLSDGEWRTWSDREIARLCKVGHSFVSNLRPSLSTVDSEKVYKTKHGTVATMNTAKIGKRDEPEPEPEIYSAVTDFPQKTYVPLPTVIENLSTIVDIVSNNFGR